MSKMSRTKGNVAEREVAALIQTWWRQLEPGCAFVRTPSSGGWGTPELRGSFRVSGDLATTSTTFPFSVEVKRREGWSWTTLLAGKPSPVWGWWRQTLTAATEMKAHPMLWVRRSQQPWLVLVPALCVEPIDLEPDVRWGARMTGTVAYLASRVVAHDPAVFLRLPRA